MNQFVDYVNSLRISPQLKGDLTDPATLKGHALYLNLVNFLKPLYPQIEQQKAEKLSLSGYLYFRFLLLFDSYIDTSKKTEGTEDNDDLYRLSVAFEFHETSIRGLSELFPSTDQFWSNFRIVKEDYYKTILLEKTLSKTRPPVDEDIFVTIASGKSAICNAMVYALQSLGGTEAHTTSLLECLRHIHIGLQYQDDVDDFKKDIEDGQWTYPQFLMRQFAEEQGIAISDAGELRKYFYLSGIAEGLLKKAIFHVEKANQVAMTLQLTDLRELLEKRKLIFNAYLGEINLLMKKAELKMHRKNAFVKDQTLPAAISLGVDYLTNSLNEDYSWSDFLTSAGFGKAWVTAYVGLLLAEHDLCPALEEILTRLVSHRNGNAFNDEMILDGDSTTFLIGFQRKAGRKAGRTVNERHLNEWFSFMNEDGGWVTYRRANGNDLIQRLHLSGTGIGIDGWTSSKLCVSAAAAYVLSFFGELKSKYEETCRYLVDRISDKGNWVSYWWTSSVYATSFSVMALSRDDKYKFHAKVGAQWLADCQHADGYWFNDLVATNEASSFYTALALKALSLLDPIKYKENILKATSWLLKNQSVDGSWLSVKILRIPATDVEDPDIVKSWRLSSFGVNCLVDDHNRIFTTATVVNALLQASRFLKDSGAVAEYSVSTERI